MASQTSTAAAPDSGAAPSAGGSPSAAKSSPYKRKVSNFLINRDYQLRTTAGMVVLALVLGVPLWWMVNRQTAQAGRALDESQKALDQASEALKEATASNSEATRVFKVQAETAQALKAKGIALAPEDELALKVYATFEQQDTLKRQADAQARRANDEQKAAARATKEGNHRILIIVTAFGIILLFALPLVGIVMTHKVAGPLYKVTLYLDRIRDGRLGQIYDLRKGDQLQDFYEHFKEMHASLRAHTQGEIEKLEAVLAAAEGKLDGEALEALKSVVAQKRATLG